MMNGRNLNNDEQVLSHGRSCSQDGIAKVIIVSTVPKSTLICLAKLCDFCLFLRIICSNVTLSQISIHIPYWYLLVSLSFPYSQSIKHIEYINTRSSVLDEVASLSQIRCGKIIVASIAMNGRFLRGSAICYEQIEDRLQLSSIKSHSCRVCGDEGLAIRDILHCSTITTCTWFFPP